MPAAASADVVGRLAPSPTGRLHLGHARTFLLAWWSVRARGGKILMRLEDLDGPRVQPGMSAAALTDLEWLGLDWDGEPLVQSTGLERINQGARSLLERGLAYACSCTRADVRDAQSAPQIGDAQPRYPGTCRGRYASLEAAERESGRAAALRVRVAEGEIEIDDRFLGRRRYDVQRETGDFPILRRDHAPAYQLAVVVDDAAQGVSEVLRGDDLLPSAARQWHLQSLLGLSHPTWVHVPLVVDESGQRLAKRRDDLSLSELRAASVDPRAIVAWAARSSGLDVPDRVTPSEVTNQFDLERVPRHTVALTEAVLASLREAR